MRFSTIRELIQTQGYCGLSDEKYAQINYPLRMSPAICMAWVAAGTALVSHSVLWALVPFCILGAVLPYQPFDLLYQYGVRHLAGTPPLPRTPLRRRLSLLFASTVIATTAGSLQAGMIVFGTVLGWTAVAASLATVSAGFCIPSVIMRLVFGKPACSRRAH